MGLGGVGKLVLYQLESLFRLDIADIARKLHATASSGTVVNKQDSSIAEIRPSIDVNASNFLWKQNGNALDPVASAAHHLHLWSKLGMIINPICNGDTSPQSKQASIKNQAKQDKSKHDAVIARQQLRVLASTPLEEGVHNIEQQKLEKQIKSAEAPSTNVVPTSFPELLAAALEI